MGDSPRALVARFLRANSYNETLSAFISEADLLPDAGTFEQGDLTVERLLEEKKLYDASFNFEKLAIDSEVKRWNHPAPAIPTLVDILPNESNVLHVTVGNVYYETNQNSASTHPSVLATTADRELYLMQPEPPYNLRSWNPPLNDAPILSSVILRNRYLITTSMSGRVTLYDCQGGEDLERRRDHKKYVVKAASHEDNTGIWVATAAWDLRIMIYRLEIAVIEGTKPKLGDPVVTIELSTHPEDILFVKHPESSLPILVVTRRDSSSMHYYAINNDLTEPQSFKTTLLGSQNLAPNSNTWIAFSPSSIALCPTDPSIIAVATSSIPHMKLIIVRLLLPPIVDEHHLLSPTDLSQASQARDALAIQDREAAAIIIHCNTLAPQTQYSTPSIAWRPDGTGVWVNGDDGSIRGIEVSTGKIIASLNGGHEAGVKIRCLWSGFVNVARGKSVEMVVSGGFDRRLVIWNPQPEIE